MIKNYYLDESGNTGDLTLAAPEFHFAGQPYFVLSCFGYDDETRLEAEVLRLRRRHRVQAPELKFAFVREKPRFMCDLLAFLQEAASPIMVEATDKKFSLCTNIIESLIVPAICPADWDEGARFMKNAFADSLSAHLSKHVLTAFCEACSERTTDSLANAFDTIEAWAQSMPTDEIMSGILMFLQDTKNDFQNVDKDNSEALKRFLPIPDATRSGKPVHILPHVYSLLHIYGRLNRHTKGRLSDISLHHDEQVQFDRALQDGMTLAESGVGENLPRQPQADFRFVQKATLNFQASHRSIGIQVADLLAGAVAFGLNELNKPQPELSQEWKLFFRNLLNACDIIPGTGVNVVAATSLTLRFHALRDE